MISCAYDLNIDVSSLRQELLQFQTTLEYKQEDWGSLFISKEKLGKHTDAFYEMFPNSFLKKVRFIDYTQFSETNPHHFHIDVDVANQGYYEGEIHHMQIRQASINILLCGDKNIDTLFAVDLESKYDSGLLYFEDRKFKVIHSKKTTDHPMLLNTGMWHKSDPIDSTRKIASFIFHPFVSFIEATERCKAKGVLIE